MLKIWLQQIRANFLVLAVFLALIGVGLAYRYASAGVEISITEVLLIILGVVLSHVSVNLFNEYSDFRSGIDHLTRRTPFSGGSGMLSGGYTRPQPVMLAAAGTLAAALAIGAWFAVRSHWVLVPVMAISAFTIVGYTKVLARLGLGELMSGITLGSLVVIGTYVALTASPGLPLNIPAEVWLISVPPGILTSLLLLLNEFPDVEADKHGGRRHLLIRFGRQFGSRIYAVAMGVVFVVILALPLAGISSFWVYLALLPAPLAFKAVRVTLLKFDDAPGLLPAMGSNVLVVLLTDLMLACSLFIVTFAR